MKKSVKSNCCEICNRELVNIKLLKNHIKNVHNVKNVQLCPEISCRKIFQSGTEVVKHFTEKHDDYRLKCNKCDKTFTSPRNMKRHRVVHDRKARSIFHCSICKRGFLTPDYVIKHEKICKESLEKGEYYKCEFCKKGFASESLKNRHFAKKHKGKKTLQCDICEMTYTYSSDLRRHIRERHIEPLDAGNHIQIKETQESLIDDNLHVIGNTLKNQKCDSCEKELCQDVIDFSKDYFCNVICKMNKKIVEQNEIIKNLQNKILELEVQNVKESSNTKDFVNVLERNESLEDVIDQMNDKIMRQNELLKNVFQRLASLEKVQEK